MDYRLLDEKGSFKAWGVGLHYEYDGDSRILDITGARLSRPIIYFDVNSDDHGDCDDVKDYVALFDKISQIHALNFSNNRLIDLTDILAHARLKPILQQISTTAARALYLRQHKFSSFNKDVNTSLPNNYKIIIRKVKATQQSNAFFSACLHSGERHKNIKSHDFILHKMLSYLSSEISVNLITQQLSMSDSIDLNESIRLASEISTLSATLNPDFRPVAIRNKTNNSMHKTKNVLWNT